MAKHGKYTLRVRDSKTGRFASKAMRNRSVAQGGKRFKLVRIRKGRAGPRIKRKLRVIPSDSGRGMARGGGRIAPVKKPVKRNIKTLEELYEYEGYEYEDVEFETGIDYG